MNWGITQRRDGMISDENLFGYMADEARPKELPVVEEAKEKRYSCQLLFPNWDLGERTRYPFI